MAVGNLYKRRDADLVPTNVKPGVDIFGVVGTTPGLIIGENLIGNFVLTSSDSNGSDSLQRRHRTVTHDNGDFIVHAGYDAFGGGGDAKSEQQFFLKINKTTGAITKHIGFAGWSAFGLGIGAYYQLIGGKHQYTVYRNPGPVTLFSFDDDGFNTSHIYSGTVIGGEGSASLFGKTISPGQLLHTYVDFSGDRVRAGIGTFNFS